MADENEPISTRTPAQIEKILLEPLNHALAAGERKALELGVNPELVVEMNVNHLASVVAMIDPPEARAFLVKSLVAQFSGLVAKHVQARQTTKGGVFVPRPGDVAKAVSL